jgi:ribosomal protein S18 acetylase RimI-like enzyme
MASDAPAADLREATVADEDVLLGLMREFYTFERLAFDEARLRTALRTLFADPMLGRAWIITRGGEVAGYAVVTVCFSLEFAGRFALIDELYVREAFRGRGLGTRALELAANACRGLDVAAVRLEVDVWNERAMELYRRMGFELQERYLMSRWLA